MNPEEKFELKGRQYLVAACSRPLTLPRPFAEQPYVCMLWDAGIGATIEERRIVVEALIDSRCRYVVCGGDDCEVWEEAADWAYVAREFDEAEERDRFIMTTSHTGESLEEVVNFAVQFARYDDIDFENLLFIALGGDEATVRRLVESVRKLGAAWQAG
jgi:hypothetical protein